MTLQSPRADRFGMPISIGCVLVYGAVLSAYLLRFMPVSRAAGIGDFAFAIFAVLWPVACNAIYHDRAIDAGIRLDNLTSATGPIFGFTVLCATGITLIGAITDGFHDKGGQPPIGLLAGYLVWGTAQQYLLNGFAMRRLTQAGVNTRLAALMAAAVFALIHAPNWPLVAVTFVGGLGWCALFSRWPNILLLGLSQAILAVLIYQTWPDAWMARLTIGRGYLHYIGSL